MDASQHVSPRHSPAFRHQACQEGVNVTTKPKKMTYLERFSLGDAQNNCLDWMLDLRRPQGPTRDGHGPHLMSE
jgi:hypothetical protein